MLVKQRGDFDCVLATLAMAAGKPYEELFDEEFCQRIEDATTCDGDNLKEAYRRAGFTRDVDFQVIYIGNKGIRILRRLLWKRRALLQVPSLNYPDSEHFIYWDGDRLYDPSNKQTYDHMHAVFPTYITLFKD